MARADRPRQGTVGVAFAGEARGAVEREAAAHDRSGASERERSDGKREEGGKDRDGDPHPAMPGTVARARGRRPIHRNRDGFHAGRFHLSRTQFEPDDLDGRKSPLPPPSATSVDRSMREPLTTPRYCRSSTTGSSA